MASRDYDEKKLLFAVRVGSIIMILISIVFLVIVDVAGRLFRDPNFHVETAMFGTLVGALLMLIIPEIRQVFPPKKNGNGDEKT